MNTNGHTAETLVTVVDMGIVLETPGEPTRYAFTISGYLVAGTLGDYAKEFASVAYDVISGCDPSRQDSLSRTLIDSEGVKHPVTVTYRDGSEPSSETSRFTLTVGDQTAHVMV
jgi:hypothetical protein